MYLIRSKLRPRDLFAQWAQVPCFEEECVIDIKNKDGAFEVLLSSYLHHRPSEFFKVRKIKETKERLELTQLKGSDTKMTKVTINFVKTKEIGTIEVKSDGAWNGLFHR